jgi:neutral/alkaline ceramidase-like enzyme
MSGCKNIPIGRRDFVAGLIGGTVAAQFATGGTAAIPAASALKVGEGVADITPPLGIELGGFHRLPGNERRVQGIRQRSLVRALVLQYEAVQVVLVSLDICGLGHEMATRVRAKVASQTSIPAENIRLCATHTHSAPGFLYLRQWGAVAPEYMATVEKQILRAVELARDDLAPAEVSLGTSRAVGANFNRTTETWKEDDQFTAESSADERWLDSMLHLLHFQRAGGRKDLLWYHFSAHPVCFADEMAGPDFPGMVAERLEKSHGMSPSLLQGHAGDVNPGDGSPWRGDAEETTQGVYDAIVRALEQATRIKIDRLQSNRQPFDFPLDMRLFAQWISAYQQDPGKCASGHWVDARFAQAWYEDNKNRDPKQTALTRSISSLMLGPVGIVFHPAELYSYYGLSIRQKSPAPATLVVGYTDGLVGYLADPVAYEKGEYSAFTVPKIVDYPPFQPEAAAKLSAALVGLMAGARSGR